MKIIEIDIIAKEPLIVTNGSAEGMAHSCLDFIPASKLLGAFASRWIHAHKGQTPDDSSEFQKLFLSGQVSWGMACPLCGTEKCVPVPLCFMREKSMGGLPLAGEKAAKSDFAVFNVLPLDEEDNLTDFFHKHTGNKDARAKFKKLSATFMQPQMMRQPEIHNVWNTRVALDDKRCAQESQLFGFSAMASGTAFNAEILCADEQAFNLLKKLIEDNRNIRIGHARSAGYGKIEINKLKYREAEEGTSEGKAFNIFLLSDYLPDPAWENPLENLVKSLRQVLDQKITVAKQYVAFRQIEGFNSHWHKWRDTRLSLQAGSVLQLKVEARTAIKNEFMLGADTLEGYGRILVNPGFLREVDIPIPEIAGSEKATEPRTCRMPSGPTVNILRERATERFARQQALKWLQEEKWQKFLDSVQKLDYPTASQRANIINMDVEAFNAMLKKSAADQWKTQACFNPFGSGRDFLSSVMQKLLDRDRFLGAFPSLEATPMFAAENEHINRAYELFKHHLVRSWGKSVRTRQNEPGGKI